MSLDRLINLARRTGDRLIVHDPVEGSDIVIMDVDEYEFLVSEDQGVNMFGSDERNVRGLTERQLLDQINRDIAIWRANDKLEDEYQEDVENTFLSSLSEGQQKNPDWHTAGSVLNDRIDGLSSDFDMEDNFDPDDYPEVLSDENKKDKVHHKGIHKINGEGREGALGQEFEMENFDIESVSPANTENKKLVKGPAEELVTQIPYKENFGGNTESWHEEPLSDDEPVFYEEPV